MLGRRNKLYLYAAFLTHVLIARRRLSKANVKRALQCHHDRHGLRHIHPLMHQHYCRFATLQRSGTVRRASCRYVLRNVRSLAIAALMMVFRALQGVCQERDGV